MVRQVHHPEPSRRAKPNFPNSKFQTIDLNTVVTNDIITVTPSFAKRCDLTVVKVLVIEYCNL